MSQVFNPLAGSSAFLEMIPQAAALRQRGIGLNLAQQEQEQQAQQWAQLQAYRQQQFAADEAQRAAANQQWQAEQDRLKAQAAANQRLDATRLGLSQQDNWLAQQRFQYDQQQDQRAAAQDQATRGANASYLGNMGLQRPGMQGPPMPVDMGAMSPGMQAFAAGHTAKEQAIEQVRAEQAARMRARFNYYNSNGSWMAAPAETIEELIDEGYGEFIPKDVLAKKGIPDPEAMAQMQTAFNAGDLGGFVGPMAQAGADVTPSFMLQTAKAMQPDATDPAKVGPVRSIGSGRNAMQVGQNTPIPWDPMNPRVAAWRQRAIEALYSQPMDNPPGTWLGRRFGSPERSDPELGARADALAQQFAREEGFVPTGVAAPGAPASLNGQAPAAAPPSGPPPGMVETIDQMILRGASDDEIRRALGAQ